MKTETCPQCGKEVVVDQRGMENASTRECPKCHKQMMPKK